MKILPVSLSVNKHYSSTNFTGLWGNNKYYPFADETSEQIENERKIKTSSPVSYLGSIAVSIMSALPFTSNEFLKYTKNRLNITKQRLIEKHLFQKNLSVIR